MPSTTILLASQPATLSKAQLAAVLFLARYVGHTHSLYVFPLRPWFGWCERATSSARFSGSSERTSMYIRHLGNRGQMDSSVVTMMHGARGDFRLAHIDGLITADPPVYDWLPKVHRDESRTQGLDRLELIRFLEVAQRITVHHGALGYLLASTACAARKPGSCGSRTTPGHGGSVDLVDVCKTVWLRYIASVDRVTGDRSPHQRPARSGAGTRFERPERGDGHRHGRGLVALVDQIQDAVASEGVGGGPVRT